MLLLLRPQCLTHVSVNKGKFKRRTIFCLWFCYRFFSLRQTVDIYSACQVITVQKLNLRIQVLALSFSAQVEVLLSAHGNHSRIKLHHFLPQERVKPKVHFPNVTK